MPRGGRQIALIGDAELDEGACWEAIADPMVARLGEVMWVVDLNRQSLDRVVPDIAAGRLAAMFEAAGWHTVMVKYGPRLQQRPELRARIDAMPNEEYQRLLRADATELRSAHRGRRRRPRRHATCSPPSATSAATTSPSLIDGYRQADAVRDRPSVVFAYTIKGWSLPTEGHPANHSALLNHEQYRELAAKLGGDPDDPWAPLDGDAEARAVPRRPASGCKRGSTRAVQRAEACRTTSAASTPARPPRSRRSGASSSTSRARPRTSPSAS